MSRHAALALFCRAAESLLSLLFLAQEQEIGSANKTWLLPQGSAEHYH